MSWQGTEEQMKYNMPASCVSQRGSSRVPVTAEALGTQPASHTVMRAVECQQFDRVSFQGVIMHLQTNIENLKRKE